MKGNGIDYYAVKISKDDIIKRRAVLRQILKNTKFGNSSNDELDSMRATQTNTNFFIVEDSKGYETVIGYKNTPNDATNNDKGK